MTNQILKDNKKIIFLDWSVFLHRSVFSWESTRKKEEENKSLGNTQQTFFNSPPEYRAINSIISCLKHVGVDKDDIIFVACDGRKNWRKDYDKTYKANRKAIKEKDQIDWLMWYQKFGVLIKKLEISTPLQFFEKERLEADDLISYGVRKFKNNPCVIVSTDADFEQLLALDNVRLFSPVSKKYKFIKNPYKILAKKLEKEKTDNLESPLLNEADFNIRYAIVNLLTLPEFVEKLAEECYSDLDISKKKEYNMKLLPYNSLRERFEKLLLSQDEAVNYEKSLQKEFKKKTKKYSKGRKLKNGICNSKQIF